MLNPSIPVGSTSLTWVIITWCDPVHLPVSFVSDRFPHIKFLVFSQKFELKFEANFCSNFLSSLPPSHSFLLQPFSKLSSPIINQPNTSKLCSKSWDIHSFIICDNYSIKPHEIAWIHTWLIKSKETWKSTKLACFWLKKVHNSIENKRKRLVKLG